MRELLEDLELLKRWEPTKERRVAICDEAIKLLGTEIEVGDVVQINPASDDRFAACFLVVEEVKPWGFQGYITVPGLKRKVAHYRVNREDCERLGSAPWTLEE